MEIDPAVLNENPFWANADGELKDSTWFKNFSGTIEIQDVTTHPHFKLESESIDFFQFRAFGFKFFHPGSQKLKFAQNRVFGGFGTSRKEKKQSYYGF